jgi:hypothetical protein
MSNTRRIDTALCVSAQKHASKNRAEIEASTKCSCFFCFRSFKTTDIKAWIDSNQTALCPKCGVDSVLGSLHRSDDAFLRGMHEHFFAATRR